MPLFPHYDFDVSTNYDEAELTVIEMLSFIDEKRYSGNLKPYAKAILTEVDPIITAMRYNGAGKLNNIDKWKKNIETAYKLLYPLTA